MKKYLLLMLIPFFFCQCEKDLDPDYSEYTDPRDGYTYRTVILGTQEWFAENLRYLPEVHSNLEISTTEIQYFVVNYPGDNLAEAKRLPEYNTYGTLYNRPSALVSCPDGWHLPDEDELTELRKTVGSRNGAALRSTSYWPSDMKGTNASGFNLIPHHPGAEYCGIWSTGQASDVPGRVYLWGFPWSANKFEHDDGPPDTTSPVRCIKD